MRHFKFISLALLFFLPLTALSQAQDATRQRWVARSHERLGQDFYALAPQEQAAVMKKSDDEILDSLLASGNFERVLLDFYLYFLAHKVDAPLLPASEGGAGMTLDVAAFHHPQALAALRDSNTESGFLRLFELNDKVYLTKPQPVQELKAKDGRILRDRQDMSQEIRRSMNAFADLLDSNQPDYQKFCNIAYPFVEQQMHRMFEAAGLGGEPYSTLIFDWYLDALIVTPTCLVSQNTELRNTVYKKLKIEVPQKFDRLMAIVEDMAKASPPMQKVSDLRAVPLDELTINRTFFQAFSAWGFWVPFRNSSTNQNRRRAAYVLSTYFCDQLTPIAIPELSSEEKSERHGGAASCQSCHYKLDPMAGFFRRYGSSGANYSDLNLIIFDDFVSAEGDAFKNYSNQWLQAGSKKARIGYIRSSEKEELNDFGDGLDELFGIVRKSPETYQCFSRKLAQYFLGQNQTFDPSWLDEIARQLDPTRSSKVSMKGAVKQILKSEALKVDRRDTRLCYDRGSSSKGEGLPCEIESILMKNCKLCHSTLKAEGGLDLSRWSLLPDGSHGFPFKTKAGEFRSLVQSLGSIKERLSTSDPEARMPQKKTMSEQDRAALYLWTERQLEQIQKGKTP